MVVIGPCWLSKSHAVSLHVTLDGQEQLFLQHWRWGMGPITQSVDKNAWLDCQ